MRSKSSWPGLLVCLLLAAAAPGCDGSIGGPSSGGDGVPGDDDDDDDPAAPDGGGGGGEPVCDQVEPIQITEAQAPDLLLVVDKSGSMADPLGTGEIKWLVMRSALQQIVEEHEDGINFGLQLFPSNNECAAGAVLAGVAPLNAQEVSGALAVTLPLGGTPTHSTLSAALAYYQSIPVNPHGRYVLLATDGLPNCRDLVDPNDPTVTETIAAIQALADAGIPTYVLGFGGAVNADPTTLQAMATAGGTGNYHAANSPAELQAALDAIAGEVSVPSCTFNLEEAPADPGKLGVFFDDQPVPQSPSHADGWDYDATTNTITFYGPACDRLQSGAVSEVRVDYGCGGPIVL